MTGVRGFCEKSLSQFDAQTDVSTRSGVKMGRLEKVRAVVRLEVIYLFEIIFEKYLKGHTPALKGHTPALKGHTPNNFFILYCTIEVYFFTS